MQRIRKPNEYPNDPRVVEEAQYKGFKIRVVAAYNIQGDDHIVHLYIAPPSGPEIAVFDPPRSEQHLDEALDHAFSIAISNIDQMTP